MKKQSFLLPVILLLLLSCRHQKQQARKVNWDDYRKAYAFLNTRNDSAFYYFNKVAGSSIDTLQTAMAYNNMAAIQLGAGDYFGAQQSASASLKFLDENKARDHSCLANDYNILGMAGFNLKNYDQAIDFYSRSIQFADDPSFRPVLLNNKANAYQKKKDYARALRLYRQAMKLTAPKGPAYARILTNLATTKWLFDIHYNAGPGLLQALYIRQSEKDFWGENSSYAHLADFYTHSHADSALFYAGRMYAVARQLSSPDDELEALQKLIALGPVQDAKLYFARYQQLSDSLQTARNAAKNQFALIRYDAEKNKADNLRLQKDNTEERYQIIKQRLMLGGALLTLVAGSITAVFWYRKRKQRLELEARKRELRISQKVHDVVANGLYQIITKVEHQDDIDKSVLLDELEVVFEQSRDISYEKPVVQQKNFHEKISTLLKSFANTATKVAVAGNSNDLWEKVGPDVRNELEYVLRELVINMRKHSQATSVALRFELQGRNLHIYYTDNGIGFPSEIQYGNGLTNTGNRIKDMNGTIIFDAESQQGVKIHISIPIQHVQ